MRVTLVLPESIAQLIAHEAARPVECGGMIIARAVSTEEGMRLLARKYIPVPEEHYELQMPDELKVRSEGFVPALSAADSDGAIAIWFHTHPGHGSAPLPSAHDDRVNDELAESVRIRTNQDYYGWLIASPNGQGAFCFSGSLEAVDRTLPIHRVWIVGERLQLLPAFGSVRISDPARYDRNVRAFGQEMQSTICDLKVGVAGCGGTGSAVLEQLTRLGVRDFVVVDPKALSESNVTRVYGSWAGAQGIPKVSVARDNVLRVAPNARCKAVEGSLSSASVAQEFADCDLVFGCTDDEAGRLVLSRLSTYMICPVIDCGVLISSDQDGRITGIDGRVTVLSPGSACLLCRNRIDLSIAAAQMLPSAERELRQAQGYAPALDNIEPSVVVFTTAVAAAAVGEMMERMIGYGPSPRPSEILLRMHERETSTNRSSPRNRHYCHEASGLWGAGIREPFLDLSWPS